MGRASGSSVTCYVHGDKSPYSGAHHAPNIYLKFTATTSRNGSAVSVKLSSMTYKALGGYGYPLTVWAAVTATSTQPSYGSSLWVKIDKSTATSAVTWTRKPSAKTLTVANDLNPYVYIHIAAHSTDAKSCYGAHKKVIATYTYNAPVANYTITYNANGGENAPPAATVNPGDNYTVTDQIPYANLVVDYHNPYNSTLVDFTDTVPFTFLRWNTAADGSGDSYVAGDEILNINKNITLYAQWDPISYTMKPFNNPLGIDITFNPMGGSVTPTTHHVSYDQAGYGTTVYLPAVYTPGQSYTFAPTHLNLYQLYNSPRIATVTDSDLPPELADSSITRGGYVFLAWYFESTLETRITTPYTTNTNFTLYAKWKPLPIYKKTDDEWTAEEDNFVWECVEVTEGGVTSKVWKKIAPIYKCVDDGGQKSWKLMSE